jgi:hypothetical protein
MTYRGRIENGTVVIEEGADLPEGAVVSVTVISNGQSPIENATPTIWQKLAQLGRDMEKLPCDLPSDLAANHDHYLHGLPKRQ